MPLYRRYRSQEEGFKIDSIVHGSSGNVIAQFYCNKKKELGWILLLDKMERKRGDREKVASWMSELSGAKHEECYKVLFTQPVGDVFDVIEEE